MSANNDRTDKIQFIPEAQFEAWHDAGYMAVLVIVDRHNTVRTESRYDLRHDCALIATALGKLLVAKD